MLSGVVSFSRWVIDSERRSLALAESAGSTSSIVGTISGEDTLDDVSQVADELAIDAEARADELSRFFASGTAPSAWRDLPMLVVMFAQEADLRRGWGDPVYANAGFAVFRPR